MSQRADEPQRDRTADVPPDSPKRTRRILSISIIAGALAIVLVGVLLVHRVDSHVDHTAMSDARPVTAVRATAHPFRESRQYVGAVAAWQEASIGPQYISAYVTSVAVRPGDVVHHNEVLATLDCSHPTAASRAAEAAARAVEEHQRALADEAAREHSLLDGGFVAPNEVEQKTAETSSEAAQLLQSRAQSQSAAQNVGDCTLRAPFDGEIGSRSIDPGAFVVPGANIVSVVDRATVRVVVDAPEQDFKDLAPGTPVHIEVLATGANVDAKVSRRAPKADPKTRTVHFEVDVPDPQRQFPVDTTAVVHVDVGSEVDATEVPVYAATEQDGNAKLFVVDGNVVHERRLPVLGESGGSVFFKPVDLAVGAAVVTEGRALLSDGDRVAAKLEAPPAATSASADARGGGYGRPL